MNISRQLCLIFCFSSVAASGLLRYCAPKKVINGVNRIQNACTALEKTQHSVQCITANDRMTCYKMLVNGQIDFMVAEPEDLRVMNTYDESRVVVTHQLKKFADASPQLEVEMFAIVKNDSDKSYTTKGKKLCYLGLETSPKTEFDHYYTSYFESWLFVRGCDPHKTLLENRIASLSEHFNSSCIAGPWSLDPVIDNELKAKYKNLCALCANPSKCSEEDDYHGMNGVLKCLRHGIGDIAWISKSDAMKYVAQLVLDEYSVLCQDGTLAALPKNLNDTCTWITDPRPVIVANPNVGVQVLHRITSDQQEGASFSQIIHASYKFSHLHKMNKPEDLQKYLTRFPGYYSASVKALTRCRSNRSVRWCVASKLEARKCESLEKAANAIGINPSFSCVTMHSRHDCIKAVSDGKCDVFVSKPEEEYPAKKLSVRPIIDLIAHRRDESNEVAAIIRKNSTFKTYSDLKGSRACFTGYKSVGWNALFWTLKNGSIELGGKDYDVISDYFKESCVLGLNHQSSNFPKNLYSLCRQYDSNLGAEEKTFQCLMDGADVAFVNVSAVKTFASQSIVFNANYKVLCPTTARKEEKACYLTKINVGSILAHENITKIRKDDIYSMFLALDRYFGETFDRETPMFDMYAPFEGITNVIFPDTTMKFERAVKYGRYAADLDLLYSVYNAGAHTILATHVILSLSIFCSFYLYGIVF